MKRGIVAIIPARGGSKGILRKNIRLIMGKPMIAYAIESALKCKYLDKVIVSTDDKEIARISKKYGADVIMRPEKLSGDKSPVILALQHVIENLGEEDQFYPKMIVLLQPTSPLRVAKDIDLAIEKYLSGRYESVVSVCEIYDNPYLYYQDNNNFISQLIKSKLNFSRRQEIPKTYRINGAVYVVNTKMIMDRGKIFSNKTGAIVMPQSRSVDIDEYSDLKIVRSRIKKINNLL